MRTMMVVQVDPRLRQVLKLVQVQKKGKAGKECNPIKPTTLPCADQDASLRIAVGMFRDRNL
jgi:hypothetical protein